MATSITPDQIGTFFNGVGMGGFNVVAQYLLYAIIGLVAIAGIYALITFFSYKIKVVYYPVQGDPENKQSWVLGRPKKDYAKITKVKGIEHLKLLFTNYKTAEIPQQYIYPDGLFMLRLRKKEFIPIKRPFFSNSNPEIHIEPHALDIEFWGNMEYQNLRQRFVDEDHQKRLLLTTTAVLVGLIVLVGVVIWMNVAYNSAALEKTNQIVDALNALGNKIGIG